MVAVQAFKLVVFVALTLLILRVDAGRLSDILDAMQVPAEHQSSVTTDAAKFRFLVSRLGTGADAVPDSTMEEYMRGIENVAESTYPSFLRGADPANNQRELCAFMDIINWETEFTTFEEIACKGNAGSNPKCDYTDRTVPFVDGKQYYGRGPKQLSWNYNYLEYSRALFGDDRLLSQPELVLENTTVMWGSAIWFWMSQGKEGATNYGGFCPPQAVWSCQETCTAWLANPIGVDDGGCGCEAAMSQGHYITPGKLSPHEAMHSDAGILGVVNIVNGGYDCCPKTTYGPLSNVFGHTTHRVMGYLTCTELFGLVDDSVTHHFHAGDTCPVVNTNNAESCPDCSCLSCEKSGSTWFRPWKCEASSCNSNPTTPPRTTVLPGTTARDTTTTRLPGTTARDTTTTRPVETPSTSSIVSLSTRTTTSVRSTPRSCKTCNECVAIPGNPQNVNDAHCAPCALDRQSFWPCDIDALCQCADGPPSTTRAATASTSVISTTTHTTTSSTSDSLINSAIHSGSTIFLKSHAEDLYVDVETLTVQSRWNDKGAWQALVIEKIGGGVVHSGDAVFLRAHTGKYLDVQGTAVQASWDDMGTWQTLVIENPSGGPILSEDLVCFKAHTGKRVVIEDGMVHASSEGCDPSQLFVIQKGVRNAIHAGHTVFLRAHTGKHLEVENDLVQARWHDQGSWQAFQIESHKNRAVFSGDIVFLEANTGKHLDIEGDEVRARWHELGTWQSLVVEKIGGGAIYHGDSIFLRAHTGSHIDVEDQSVRARWNDYGTWQTLTIESSVSSAQSRRLGSLPPLSSQSNQESFDQSSETRVLELPWTLV